MNNRPNVKYFACPLAWYTASQFNITVLVEEITGWNTVTFSMPQWAYGTYVYPTIYLHVTQASSKLHVYQINCLNKYQVARILYELNNHVKINHKNLTTFAF